MAQDLPKAPIGTIVAYAGGMDAGWLEQQGWLYCDGRPLEKSAYANLFFVLGTNYGGSRTTFNLPDLRGRFQRGVDLNSGRDPQVKSRPASGQGGLSGDNPGSVQAYLTARPVKDFVAATAGAHTHPVPHAPTDNNAYAVLGSHYGIWNNDTAKFNEAGEHTHTIASGGDTESRPINKYVYFLIKFTDTPRIINE